MALSSPDSWWVLTNDQPDAREDIVTTLVSSKCPLSTTKTCQPQLSYLSCYWYLWKATFLWSMKIGPHLRVVERCIKKDQVVLLNILLTPTESSRCHRSHSQIKRCEHIKHFYISDITICENGHEKFLNGLISTIITPSKIVRYWFHSKKYFL